MATSKEGGATGKTTTAISSYGGGGGGAGGKFRKKPFRRPTTPYERPPVALRGNGSKGSWLTKLVVDPASKLISYGAHRLFASVFRKRLPPPPPPQTSELNHVLSDKLPEAVSNLKNHYGAQVPSGDESSQPVSSSGRNGISELEHLLKQKTFTKSEIDHLTELLHSRAGEEDSLREGGKRNEGMASDFGRCQQLQGSPFEANRNQGERSHGILSTPISNPRVLEDGIASPAELAKAYIGSTPSKVSPLMLGKNSQVTREDTRLLSNMRFAPKPAVTSLTTTSAFSPGSSENGFVTTQRSRGRSAIHSISHSLYSKGSGINRSGYSGLTMPSSSLSLVDYNERSGPKSMALKRRSYVLDDEVGSVGPIRRIRQKSNLIAHGIPRSANGVGIDSDAALVSSKQKLPLIRDPKHCDENADNSIPSTSYSQAPSQSGVVAARISGHLEKMTPKEKVSEFKSVAARDKPFKLTPSMLRGQALRSMEDFSSSELLLNVQDDHKFESRSSASLSDARDLTSQGQGKVEENGPAESCAPSTTFPVMKSDSAMSLKASCARYGSSDSVLENSISQPKIKIGFRMSAQEDYVELDDDLHCNGLATGPFFEGRSPTEAHLMDSKFSRAEEPTLVKMTIQPEVKSPSVIISSKTSELNGDTGAEMLGERSTGIAIPALEEITAAAESAVLPPSIAAFDKHKETINPPFFSFRSKVADNFPPLTSESRSRILDTNPESSSRLLNISVATGSLVKIPEPEKDGNLKPLVTEDRNGDSDTVLYAASNGPLISSAPAGSFAAVSASNINQNSTGVPAIFTHSTSVSNFSPFGTGNITSDTSNGSIFDPAATPTTVDGPFFKFGATANPLTTVSAASITDAPGGDSKTKTVVDQSSGSSSHCRAANSGNITFGLGSSASYSTVNTLQASQISSASEPLVSAAGTVSQGTSLQLVSFASPPSVNTTGSTSFVSSLYSSQVVNPVTSLGFNSSSSSSDTGAIVPSSGSTSCLFSLNSAAVSDGSAGSSSSVATPSISSFVFNSSSSSTNAVVSIGGSAPPVLGFGASSSVTNTITSFSSSASSTNAVGLTGGSTPTFNFGASSTSVSSSIINTVTSFSSSASSANAVGSTGGNTSPVFSFGASSPASGVFNFGGNSLGSASAINSVNGDNAPSNSAFISSWQMPKSSTLDSTLTSASPARGFSFGALPTSSAPTNVGPSVFNSSGTPSSTSPFPSLAQSIFGNQTSSFAASPGSNNQMNAEDSMAEDPVQSTAPSIPVFGQTSVSPSPPGFMYGSTVPSQANPFQFGGQQNQFAPQNPPMFQGSSSLEFNAGGSFSLGSGGGGDKSGRKFVKINRSKNRRK